jgi:hypothetical protein
MSRFDPGCVPGWTLLESSQEPISPSNGGSCRDEWSQTRLVSGWGQKWRIRSVACCHLSEAAILNSSKGYQVAKCSFFIMIVVLWIASTAGCATLAITGAMSWGGMSGPPMNLVHDDYGRRSLSGSILA